MIELRFQTNNFEASPRWISLLEKYPHLAVSISHVLACYSDKASEITFRKMPQGLNEEQERAWARTKALNWLSLEQQLHAFVSNGASPQFKELAKDSGYSNIAKLLLPYINDERGFSLIVHEAVDELDSRNRR